MKQCSECKIYKTVTEFARSSSSIDGLQPVCKICHNFAMQEYRKSNRDKVNDLSRIRYASNAESQKAHVKKWESENLEKVRAKSARRRAAKLHRTPPWLTELHHQQIQIFYDAAADLTKEFGIPVEVDHVVPLQGKNVSGLHVPWNLQVITKRENLIKGNRITK